MQCRYNESSLNQLNHQQVTSQKCLSCPWINRTYSQQIYDKQNELTSKIARFNPKEILPAVQSREGGFRNKAKMAVLGTVEKPILGMKNGDMAVDLCDCPLYSKNMQIVLKMIRTYIRKQRLIPYNTGKRKGELKFVIVTESDCGFMIRFVLRSERYLEQIRNTYQQLNIENIVVVSVNIQPLHAAILEGEKEITLTNNQLLPFRLNEIPLFIKPKSFFQTNTEVAAKLYKTASHWIDDLDIKTVWDLFCGVGGFGLHCVEGQNRKKEDHATLHLVGIEINAEAIACAKQSAKLLGIENLSFQSLDVNDFALLNDKKSNNQLPDLVLVNPPRRGMGKIVLDYLTKLKPRYILYSSCNLKTLVDDLSHLSQYQLEKIQLFDMFPHTSHMEILTFLRLKS